MKQGTFLIIEKEGFLLAVIRRVNQPDIELDWLQVTDAIQKASGQTCLFTNKGNNVIIAGITYYKPEIPKQVVKQAVIQKSLNQLMRESANDDLVNDIANN